ncbi:transcription repressor NadR [Jeotgalibacillus soli]|uniref:Transcriptional regulator n=1 Tax=Jeotgalibacillus soli TaxID=889306 RepID=A0A0C2VJ86_9BACL|nr:transcription repressor NadR [Jeotgalibacillus soli]KIL44541.1 transcriptional regulator [Jeotgalibacillus soli]
MPRNKKINGESRREEILKTLKESQNPITGSELARQTNVSRQVIVSDITLLKARDEPILATSQGYLFMPAGPQTKISRTIVCRHTPEQSETEMMIIVEAGALIKNVSIEHPVYGDLTASMMLSSKEEVQSFLKKISDTDASFLSELTGGIHLHEIVADQEETIQRIEDRLFKEGILIRD